MGIFCRSSDPTKPGHVIPESSGQSGLVIGILIAGAVRTSTTPTLHRGKGESREVETDQHLAAHSLVGVGGLGRGVDLKEKKLLRGPNITWTHSCLARFLLSKREGEKDPGSNRLLRRVRATRRAANTFLCPPQRRSASRLSYRLYLPPTVPCSAMTRPRDSRCRCRCSRL